MGPRREDCRRWSEAELAALALEGRVEAWDEIVQRHSHRVRLALLARGVPWDEAEDLVQETWVRLVQQQRAGRLRELRMPGLAVAQAGWLAREAWRTRTRREAIASMNASAESNTIEEADTDPERDPEAHALRNERSRLLQRELSACPARVQEVFRAVYGREPRGHAEVAAELGMSVQRVRQILCETKARLRGALAGLENGDEPWNT